MNKHITSLNDLGRLQPQAVELEIAVLGAMLLESEAINEVVEILTDEDFYRQENGIIYKTIMSLSSERKNIDMLTVVESLKQSEELDMVGGPYYISQLTSGIASSYHIKEHALILKEKSIKRKTIVFASRMIDKAYDDSEDIGDSLSIAGKEVDNLMDELIGKSNGKHISEVLKKSSESLYRRVELARKNIRSGVNTGISYLNKMTNGWQPSELIILAARPAMGKTALMLHFAKSAALSGVPVALFSLEMSDVSLMDRLILSECNVDPGKYKSGYLSNEELNEIEIAKGKLYNLPIYVDDNPCVTMTYIRSRCKLLHKQGKCGIVMADYLQLAEGEDRENNREREVAKMSRLAKITAKELSIPFILLSQLNRGNETRADKKPLLSDLRESGAIEQDADIVAFVHRPSYYGISVKNKRNEEEINYGEIIIAKNRNGSSGLVKFKHNEGMNKFYDYDSDNNFPF